MDTLGTVVSILELLSEENLTRVLEFAKEVLEEQKRDDMGVEKVTRKQILSELKASRQQANRGRCKDACQALGEMRERYGV